jgi:hypothetical protein
MPLCSPLCSRPPLSIFSVLPVFIAVALPLCSCPAYFSVILPVFIAAALPPRSCPACFSVSVILPVFFAVHRRRAAAPLVPRLLLGLGHPARLHRHRRRRHRRLPHHPLRHRRPAAVLFSTCPRWTTRTSCTNTT